MRAPMWIPSTSALMSPSPRRPATRRDGLSRHCPSDYCITVAQGGTGNDGRHGSDNPDVRGDRDDVGKADTQGDKKSNTHPTSGSSSMLFSHRAMSEPAPKKISTAPPAQAVSAAARSEASPKMSGALKRMTPRAALIQSCQRIARDTSFNLQIVLSRRSGRDVYVRISEPVLGRACPAARDVRLRE